MAQEFVEKQIPLSQLDYSQIGLELWIQEQEKKGYIASTWRIENGYAHFFMVKEVPDDEQQDNQDRKSSDVNPVETGDDRSAGQVHQKTWCSEQNPFD